MTWVVAVGGFRPRRRTESEIVRTSVKCGGCDVPIGVGEVYALVTEAHLPRCADCALAMVRAAVHAAWNAAGVCPWPSQLDAEVARRVGTDTTQTDAAPCDFAERLRAAIERSQRSAHHAA